MDMSVLDFNNFNSYTNESDINKRMTNHLRVITGGGEPPTSSGNWLKDLEVGTVFFAQNRDMKDFTLQLFRVEGKDGPNDKVICIRSPSIPKEVYVDPHRFVHLFNLHHTVGVLLAPKEEIVDDDDNRNEKPQTEEEASMEGTLGTSEILQPFQK